MVGTRQVNICDNLPKPAMPVRSNLIRKISGGYQFNFLNRREELTFPINWELNIDNINFRLWLMNLHYMEYLEETNNDDFISLIENWIEHNELSKRNYDWAAWNPYALSIRTLVWMQQFAERGIDISLPRYEQIRRNLLLQLLYLERNIEKDIGGNHIIKNIKVLLWATKFFDVPASLGWKKNALKLLNAELDEQILLDGMHFELSTAYHCQVFVDLVECFLVLDESTIKTRLKYRLNKMAQVINDFTHPDGLISVFNDGSLNMSYTPSECLSAWEKLSGFKPENKKNIALASSGYYGVRNKNIYLLLDAGKVGADHLPAHSHGDIFSFELSVGNERMIVDPGVYEYNVCSNRTYSRATSSHNTLSLKQIDQCEFYGSFRLARRAEIEITNYAESEKGFELTAIHNGYKRLEGKPYHLREFKIDDNNIKINDKVIGGKGQKATANLLLHPDCVVDLVKDGLIIKKNDNSFTLHSSGNIIILSANWFPEFGKSVATKKIEIDYGFAPCEGYIKMHVSNSHIRTSSYTLTNLQLIQD